MDYPVKLTSLCIVQTAMYDTYIQCVRCHLFIEPKTQCIRTICSCGCNSVKQTCTCCHFALPNCVKKEEEEEVNEKTKKKYKERRFMGCPSY